MNATKDSITTSVESCALGDWIDNLGELAVRYAWADNPECSWKEICKAWDAGSTQAFAAVYGDGCLCVRPLGEDSFEYRIRGHRTQHDRAWRVRDRWFDLAAANGDIAHLVFQVLAENLDV